MKSNFGSEFPQPKTALEMASRVAHHPPPHEPPPPTAAPEPESLTFRDYWNILLKRAWIIILVSVLGIAGAALYTFRQPKLYEAYSTLIIEPEDSGVLKDLDVDAQGANWFIEEALFETQIKILQSRHIAERVVRELGLAENLEFLNLSHIQDEATLASALEYTDPVSHLLGMLTIEPVKDSRMLTIRVRHGNPQVAAMIANGVAAAYRDQNIDRRVQSMNDAFLWLEEQYSAYDQKLAESRRNLQAFIEQAETANLAEQMLTPGGIPAVTHQTPSDPANPANPTPPPAAPTPAPQAAATDFRLYTNPAQQQELVNQELSRLREQLIDAERQRLDASHLAEQFASILDDEQFKDSFLHTGSLAAFMNSETLSRLSMSYVELRQELIQLRKTQGTDRDEVRSLQDQIKLIEAAIKGELESSRRLQDKRLKDLRRAEGALRSRIRDSEEKALLLEKLKLLYERIQSEKDEQQRLFEIVQRRLNEVNLSKLLESNNVRILDAAQEPDAPIRPRPVFNMVLGILMGLGGGVLLAFLFEWLDNTVKSQADVERYLPFLGVLPTIHRNDGIRQNPEVSAQEYRRDLHVQFYPRSSAAECMRTIRTNLMFMAPGRPLQTLLVTSPSPLEGKTTTAISLAIVLSQSGNRVLVMDLDLRRPRLHKGFGMQIKHGVADVLTHQKNLDEVILPTGVNNLEILGCGTIPTNPSELFHSPDFQTLLQSLRERYDRIIIDSPPIIAVTDAMIIAQSIDGLVLVCRSQSTRKELLERSAQLLQGVNAPILGVVLNNVNLRNRRQGGYYYYYYRHYGQYYETPEEQDPI